ncbi:MAG: hypothetical protein AABX82_03985 [Nanoarchaeota archaeon]
MADQRVYKTSLGTAIHHMEWEADRIQYNGLEFEYQAHRMDGQTAKVVLSYDQSLARARVTGFDDGHPRPNEVFGFLIAGLEGRLSGRERDVLTEMAVFADMQTGYGEWLNAAWQVESVGSRQFLNHYHDPEGLLLVGETYVTQTDLRYSKKEVFDVTVIPLQTWVPLHRFDQALQTHLYTRRFADLPSEMKENEDEKRNAALYLPPEGVILPVARRCHGRFAIGTHKILRASRGVYSLGDEGYP